VWPDARQEMWSDCGPMTVLWCLFNDFVSCAARKDCLFLGKSHDFPALADGGKKFAWVEVGLVLGLRG
jgi:hypothetical protein